MLVERASVGTWQPGSQAAAEGCVQSLRSLNLFSQSAGRLPSGVCASVSLCEPCWCVRHWDSEIFPTPARLTLDGNRGIASGESRVATPLLKYSAVVLRKRIEDEEYQKGSQRVLYARARLGLA